MEWTEETLKLAKTYNLDERDILFIRLIASGADRGESYRVIYDHGMKKRNELEQERSKANDFIQNHPAASILIQRFKTRQPTNTAAAKAEAMNAMQEDELTEEERRKISDKSYILKKLWQSASQVTGKEKAAIFMQIADLQRMKQEESKVEEEKRQYFLPYRSRCRACELMKIARQICENGEE